MAGNRPRGEKMKMRESEKVRRGGVARQLKEE